MKCYAVQNNQMLAGGNSGESSICVATPANFIGDNMKRIPLTQGKFAIVDDNMFEYLNQWKWYYSIGYAKRDCCCPLIKQRRRLYMHRQIMSCPQGLDIDHKNHDTLNNQRLNLRVCTRNQNCQNRDKRENCASIYKGVSRNNRTEKWNARIILNGKKKHLGYFDNEIEAAKAYDEAAKELFGEYARLNFRMIEVKLWNIQKEMTQSIS